jgi:hypothetical protein
MALFIPELGKSIDFENEREYLTGVIAQGGGAKVWAEKQLNLYNRTKAALDESIRKREERDRTPTSGSYVAGAPKPGTGTAHVRENENQTPNITSFVPGQSLSMDGMIGLGAIIAVIFLLKR